MKIGKFKKLLVSILVLSLSFGMMNAPKVVSAEGNNVTKSGPILLDNTNNSDDGVHLDKKAYYNNDTGLYDITLEAYATGSVTTDSKPVDVVLVLDQSGSMRYEYGTIAYDQLNVDIYNALSSNRNNWSNNNLDAYYIRINDSNYVLHHDNDGWYYKKQQYGREQKIYINERNTDIHITRQAAILNVLAIEGGFIDELSKNNKNRIGVVTFDGSSDGSNYYEDLTNGFSQDYENVKDDVLNLKPDGGTYPKNAFNRVTNNYYNNNYFNNEDNDDRVKVLVYFTDGMPGGGYSFEYNDAKDSVNTSKNLKQNGVTVYSVGCDDSMNPNAYIQRNGYPGNNADRTNQYMHAISSNFKNASYPQWSSNISLGERTMIDGEYPNYYLYASDPESLNSIFDNIFDSISTSIKLDEKTVIKDVMSDYFEISGETDEELKRNIKVEKIAMTASGWSTTSEILTNLDINITNKQLEVSGFDYTSDDNVVIENRSGNKLLITISNVKPIEGFIGGNAVPTNKSTSGLYKDEYFKKFNEPKVDVAINYYYETFDNAMYIKDSLAKEDFKNFISTTNYGLRDGEYIYSITNQYVNDFVNIKYTIKDENGVEIGTYEVNAKQNEGHWVNSSNTISTDNYEGTKNINISVSIEPIEQNITDDGISGDYQPSSNIKIDENRKLYILVPSITSSDDQIFLGNNKNLSNQMTISDTWDVLGESNADYANILGTKPIISYTITPDDSKISNQINSNVFTPKSVGTFEFNYTVQANGKDITHYVVANHNNTYGECTGNCKQKHFYIRVIGGTISFEKYIEKMNNYPIKEDGIFIYKITNNNTNKVYYRIVRTQYNESNGTFTHNDIEDLTNLPAGNYTVEELSSMRFTCDGHKLADDSAYTSGNSVSFEINEENRIKQVSFKNSLTYDDNLSDGDVVVNSFKKNADGSISITQDWLNGKKIVNGEEEGGQ